MAFKKQAAKKTAVNNKRSPKAKQIVEEKQEKEVETSDDDSDAEEEQNGVNLDDGSNSEADGAADLSDSEDDEVKGEDGKEENDDDEDDDDDDDDDDDEDDDEEDEDSEIEPGQATNDKTTVKVESNDNDDEADSDEEPVEEPISKKEKKQEPAPKKGGIPKVPVARIPPETPKEQIISVSNLPNEYKHVELVALFTKFGPITVVNRMKTKAGGNHVQIAFESAEAANAAHAATDKALTLGGQVVRVMRFFDRNECNERTVVVGLIGPNATKESVSEHFKSCGAVESVTFSHNKVLPKAFVRFKDVSSVPNALKLNSSEMNSRFITVRSESNNATALKKPKYTINLVNTGNHQSYKAETLEKIFKKYGELVDIDVACSKSVLAFVTYKTVEQAEKAIKHLNGKTVGDLEIKLEEYSPASSARTVLVSNLNGSIGEEQLNGLFSECGEIEAIKMLGKRATIRFATDEAFCKSFLLNETVLQGQHIFLEPNSMIKHKLLQQNAIKFQGNHPGAGGKFNKFNKYNNGAVNGNDNNKQYFNKKPFNKRPAQDNGSQPQSFKKPKNF